MADYFSVVVHFTNAPTPDHKGGGLSCCAWINAIGLSDCSRLGGRGGEWGEDSKEDHDELDPEERSDGWLAVAGSDPVIQV
jgi:hypothetical protein